MSEKPAPDVSIGPRALPSVDALVRATRERLAGDDGRTTALTRAARSTLQSARRDVTRGAPAPSLATLVEMALARYRDESTPTLRRVINATGVIVNTNLGRAPLADEAIAAVTEAARGYSNLEFDLDAGERGSRQAIVRDLLRDLTGAEDALVVNNNAAAVLVVLAALADGREVAVSRGELVEIGGGFRVPDVMLQSGARLVEVGTTNRTRTADYAAAISSETAVLLAVHPSNFRIVGFTESSPLRELAELAHARGLVLVHDLGSGALTPTQRWGLAHEPTPMESVAAGVDVVCFSGDKLLGGPQAGIIAGRGEPLRRVAKHPLMRAVRIDKLSLAALEATLRLHRDGHSDERVPVWRMIAAPLDALRARAAAWASALLACGVEAEVIGGNSTVGGGSLPGETIPTALCAVGGPLPAIPPQSTGQLARHPTDVVALAAALRRAEPPVIARVHRDRLLLDPRTVDPADDDLVLRALREALAG